MIEPQFSGRDTILGPDRFIVAGPRCKTKTTTSETFTRAGDAELIVKAVNSQTRRFAGVLVMPMEARTFLPFDASGGAAGWRPLIIWASERKDRSRVQASGETVTETPPARKRMYARWPPNVTARLSIWTATERDDRGSARDAGRGEDHLMDDERPLRAKDRDNINEFRRVHSPKIYDLLADQLPAPSPPNGSRGRQ